MWTRIVLALLLIGNMSQGNAASMRCGNKVIKSSDSQKTVEKRCGKPDRQSHGFKMIKVNGVASKQRVEQWTYFQGRGKHTKILLFHENRLVDVLLEQRSR